VITNTFTSEPTLKQQPVSGPESSPPTTISILPPSRVVSNPPSGVPSTFGPHIQEGPSHGTAAPTSSKSIKASPSPSASSSPAVFTPPAEPTLCPAFAVTPPFTSAPTADQSTGETRFTSSFYVDYLRPSGIFQGVALTTVHNPLKHAISVRVVLALLQWENHARCVSHEFLSGQITI
jgi:hypothetical protein